MVTGFLSYVADLLAYFAFLGIGIHLLDRYLGVPFYRWWYSRSREKQDALPAGIEMGFLCKQPLPRLHNFCLMVSGVQSLYMLYTMKIHFFTELVAFAFEAWFMMLGFMLGDYAYRWLRGEEKIVEMIHKLTPSNLLTGAGGLVLKARDSIARLRISSPQRSEPPVESMPASEPQKPQKEMSPEEILRRYQEGRKI